MIFKFKVMAYYSDAEEADIETGLVIGEGKDECEEFMNATANLYNYYDNIESIEIAPFAPDGPLIMSETTIKEIEKEVIW